MMKKSTSFNILFPFLILIILLTSCGPTVVYDKNITIDQPWKYDAELVYDIDITDTDKLYDLMLYLDHSADFTYQNLYIQINTTYPDGKTVIDEVSLQLANSRGEFSGKCNREKCCVSIVLQEGFKFQNIGMHSIKILQHSRMPSLEGIYSGRLQLIHHKR